MMRPDVALESVLRRALGRAGVTTGYEHRCRRKGCVHQEARPTPPFGAARLTAGICGPCPKCGPSASTTCATRRRAFFSWRARTRWPSNGFPSPLLDSRREAMADPGGD